MKTNLTTRTIGYLYQAIQNDEHLYRVWVKAVLRNDFDLIKYELDERFNYTSDQLDRLVGDFQNEASYELH